MGDQVYSRLGTVTSPLHNESAAHRTDEQLQGGLLTSGSGRRPAIPSARSVATSDISEAKSATCRERRRTDTRGGRRPGDLLLPF